MYAVYAQPLCNGAATPAFAGGPRGGGRWRRSDCRRDEERRSLLHRGFIPHLSPILQQHSESDIPLP